MVTTSRTYNPGAGGVVTTSFEDYAVELANSLMTGSPSGQSMTKTAKGWLPTADVQAARAGNVSEVNLGIAPIGGSTSLVPVAGGAIATIGSSLSSILSGLGIAGAAYGGLQALGLGEGEGLFGNDLLGGGSQASLSGVELGGPGLAEPPAELVLKEWHVNYDGFKLQYYLVRKPNGSKYIFMYHTGKGTWKSWRWSTPRLAVIGKNMPSHKNIVRLRKNLAKHRADADTILTLTSPTYAAHKRRKRRRR